MNRVLMVMEGKIYPCLPAFLSVIPELSFSIFRATVFIKVQALPELRYRSEIQL